jgi:hypothetical protein
MTHHSPHQTLEEVLEDAVHDLFDSADRVASMAHHLVHDGENFFRGVLDKAGFDRLPHAPVQPNLQSVRLAVLPNSETRMPHIEKYRFLPWMDFGQDPYARRIDPTLVDVWVPSTIAEVQQIVRYARSVNKGVRVTGYRHTSSNLIAEKDQILICMVALSLSDHVPQPDLPVSEWRDGPELKRIQVVGDPFVDADGKRKQRCKFGAGACNYHFHNWVKASDGGKNQWALPMNVVMTEISLGGSNGPICHGAGVKNATLSDLVTEITFVNYHGDTQTLNDPRLLKAVAGCFGLMGVVVELVLKLDEMTYANLATVKKQPLYLTIPPTQSRADSVPHEVRRPHEHGAREKAERDFRNRCQNHYYSEFFWFPLQQNGWTNTWNNDGDKHKAIPYPITGTTLDTIGTAIANAINVAASYDPGNPGIAEFQTKLVGGLTMFALPSGLNASCTVEDAQHYHHGIQNVPCLMIEFNFPIPRGDDNQPMWEICQNTWWDIIEVFYSSEFRKELPMRTTMEMRITSGSQILMAPQLGDDPICSIEVLTPSSVDRSLWQRYVQAILNKWGVYTDAQGKPLNVRPHWAKTFEGYTDTFMFRGKPMVQYLKEDAYPPGLRAEFIGRLEEVSRLGGYSFSDAMHQFGNDFLKNFFAQEVAALSSPASAGDVAVSSR